MLAKEVLKATIDDTKDSQDDLHPISGLNPSEATICSRSDVHTMVSRIAGDGR